MGNNKSTAASTRAVATKTEAETDEVPQGLCHFCEKMDLGSLVSQKGYRHAASVEEAKVCRRTCRLCWHVFKDHMFREWEGVRMFAKNDPVRVKWALDPRVCMEFLIPASDGRNRVLFFIRRQENSRLNSSELSVVPITAEPPDNSGKWMVEKAKMWLSECVEHHSCGRPLPFFDQSNGLPKRLLDVTTRPGTSPSQIRLVNTNEIPRSQNEHVQDSSPLEYFALSHCWGPNGLLDHGKTSSSSLSERQAAISIEMLPLNFQHAIRVTRDLGAKYLWIDALCIIQDSITDWSEEGARMGAIYSNARLTIAAASSEMAAEGFLDREPTTPRPHILLQVDTTGLQEPPLGPAELLLYSNESLTSLEPNFLDLLRRNTHSLARRAWCLQENLMSGRVVHFTKGKLIWECREGFRDEFLVHPSDKGMWQRIVPKMSSLRPACSDMIRVLEGELDPLDLWYSHVIPDFTSRNITYDFDRLAATSSIARAVAWARGWPTTDYLAGVWSKDLGRGLAWRMQEFNAYEKHKDRNSNDTRDAKSVEWQNPSWSWVSAKAPIVFERGHGAYAEMLKDDPTQSSGSLVRLVRSELVTSLDPFGPVKSTGIVVEAPICFAGLLMPDAVIGYMVMRGGRPVFRKLAMADLDVMVKLPYDDAYPYGDDLTIFKINIMALYKTHPSVSTSDLWGPSLSANMRIEAFLLLKSSGAKGSEGMDCFERIGFMSTAPLFDLPMEMKTVMLV
ncbi:heterokaryon incompatibility protein-domain-containing protein [Paraphoma chrysanthemicola]|uniref:Heterokaryon incompatibility protein-domain-containing protein n=1 Tax=Paraphoma chrysanthemicola TaxID=798071 RepID=A0A8K0QVH3_9PLEO|nr:heterokaryon incompatibility protein-domain-containing protein [Paraphoma chrysanthemicola]